MVFSCHIAPLCPAVCHEGRDVLRPIGPATLTQPCSHFVGQPLRAHFSQHRHVQARAREDNGCSSGQQEGYHAESPTLQRRDLLKLSVASAIATVAGPAQAEGDKEGSPATLVEEFVTSAPKSIVEDTRVVPPEAVPPATIPSQEATSQPSTAAPGNEVPPEKSPDSEQKKPAPPKGPDTTITARVFFDITLCEGTSRPERTLGDQTNICTAETGQPLGRIVIGLYGKLVPQTVNNFLAMCSGKAGSTYQGTVFHKVVPGGYIQAGRQGSRLNGGVEPPTALERNGETIKPSAFALPHLRPGTVSLALAQNDDDEDRKGLTDYRNVQFLITTGPGPCPELDGGNIVFGTVLEGLDVVRAIAEVPTFRPSEKIRQFNELAEFLGDERAATARNNWDKPLKNVVISSCGLVKVKPMPLPAGLP